VKSSRIAQSAAAKSSTVTAVKARDQIMNRVAITGAAGNLGWKLITHLVSLDPGPQIVGLDQRSLTSQQLDQLQVHPCSGKVQFVNCDVSDWQDRRWRDALAQCEAVVHFAARNPFPEAGWYDANTSLDMTMNVALAAVDAGVRRFVFTSSNHVMGRYKDEPLASAFGPGQLTTSLEYAVGTIWHTGDRQLDSTVYAVAKGAGERLCHALAARSDGHTSFVCARVGWCQPGENLAATLSAAGTPTQAMRSSDDADWIRADRWFKQMWLSNRDFAQLFQKAIFADCASWPRNCIIVNGMSANSGMKWSLREARKLLGYEPHDDVFSEFTRTR
jgi:nucleoside-diphosphate-sugar epimerase